MQSTKEPDDVSRIALTDHEIAASIGASVHWVRKDRRGARLLPFYRVGGLVRYNRDRVLMALSAMEEGGVSARRRGATA